MHTLDMNIMWDEPVNPNGDITSYEVTVAQTDNPSDVVYTNDSLTVTNVTQSVMVLPFTNYTVTVTASTSAGQGDPESVVELSPEAGKEAIVLVPHCYCFWWINIMFCKALLLHLYMTCLGVSSKQCGRLVYTMYIIPCSYICIFSY